MTLPVFVTVAARAEIIAARDWYEVRQRGLALRFDAELDAVIDRISENPLQFPLVRKEARRAMLRRFPYGVFFSGSCPIACRSSHAFTRAAIHATGDGLGEGRPPKTGAEM